MTPQTGGRSLTSTFLMRSHSRTFVAIRRCAVNLLAVAVALLPGTLAWLAITTPDPTTGRALIAALESSSPTKGSEVVCNRAEEPCATL